MSKLCVKCGTEIPEGNKFCPECGKKVKNENDKNKKFLPLVIGGIIAVVVLAVIIGVLIVTKFGENNKEKMIKTLQDEDYSCTYDYETVCEKEEDNKKRTFKLSEARIEYEELIYDSEIVRVSIKVDNTAYNESKDTGGSSIYSGIVYAYFHEEDGMEFFPEHCTDRLDCHLRVNEKVYPALKEEYDEYKEYFASGKDKEYLRASKNGTLSASEEIRQETIYENYSIIKDNDKFTENVNDALRYYEKIVEEAGITLEKK